MAKFPKYIVVSGEEEIPRRRRTTLLGGLSNDDGHGNKNGGKAIGLYSQNNNFSHASHFFIQFFDVHT